MCVQAAERQAGVRKKSNSLSVFLVIVLPMGDLEDSSCLVNPSGKIPLLS